MPTPMVKAPITLTFDGLIQNAVAEELKKRALKTVASEGMKAAGLGDIQTLLKTFGITPTLIEKGVTMLFTYLEAQAIAKGGYAPPPASGGFGPAPPGQSQAYQSPPPPAPPRAQPPPPPHQPTQADAEATYNLHLTLLRNMVNVWGDILVSEATQKFIDNKASILAGIASPPPPSTEAKAG